jgi:hypothetical protein
LWQLVRAFRLQASGRFSLGQTGTSDLWLSHLSCAVSIFGEAREPTRNRLNVD